MSTTTESTITLKGSTEIVTEFFNYSVNSILYQRGIYPPESFKRVSQYGLSMMVTTDEGLLSYLNNIIRQLECKISNLFFIYIYLILISFYSMVNEW
jgi:mitotic spindle assembly checkpoint protein MAD2